MKRVSEVLVTILIVAITGCGGGKQTDPQSEGIITVDVTASYPEKELVLQDFMNVEYIALETTDEFVNQGRVLDVGKEFVLIGNNNARDGDIFVYDRNGKVLRKINRMGQAGEEYGFISGIILDEDNNEMFVHDNISKKFVVYDLYGNFKRSYGFKDGIEHSNIFNYDTDKLICDDRRITTEEERSSESFYIISKQDGSVVNEIKVPFKQEKSSILMRKMGEMSVGVSFRHPSIMPYDGNYILTSLSADTIFRYLPTNNNIEPFIVRTPSIQSMDPEVFLFPAMFTDQYYFVESAKKVFDIESNTGFPRVKMVYDRQERKIYEYTISNADYSGRTETIAIKTINDEIAFCQKMEPFELIEANEQGKLKGKLKEVADGLDEDDNPVIMLVKYKK